jgi:hypothetical protein
MIVSDRIDWLRQQIAGADDAPPLLRALEEFRRLEPDQGGGEEIDELRLQAFDALTRLTQDAPIITGHLLPLCLRSKGEWRAPRVAHRYDEALSAWLERFPEIHRFAIRAAVLEALTGVLASPAGERACRLVGMLGYRDERASAALLEVARAGPEGIRDVAVHALTALGVPPALRPALLRLCLERADAGHCNHDLIGAAKQLGSPDVLGPVFDQWLAPASLQAPHAARGLLPQLAIAVPAAVAEHSPDDAGLQDRVWARLHALEAVAPDLFFHRVLGSTQVAHPCDSTGVVRYYLSALAGDERTRNLAYFQLQECERPRQLLGWGEDPGQEVIEALHRDAAAPTKMAGPFTTQNFRRKLHAWQTLLSLGRDDALANLADAVGGEQNGHAIGAVLDLAACFRLDPLPSRVRDLIGGEFGDMAEDDSERVSSHINAIAVARAACSASAFEALLGFTLIREGGVLISLLDALADTAAALIHTGDTGVAERLWQAAASGQPKPLRAAAAAALGRLLRRKLLRPLPEDRIVRLLQDETLDHYARRSVLEGLGHVPTEEVTPQIEAGLRRALGDLPIGAGGNPDPHATDLSVVALTALARLGLLAKDPDTISTHLGLRLEGITWRYERRSARPGASGVLGVLYNQEPVVYAQAAGDLLREGDWAAVVQLAPFLRSGPRPAPAPVIDALLKRVRLAGPEVGEPDLISLLAELAPDRIVSERWSDMFNWPPLVRAALAETLMRHPSPDDLEKRNDLLLVLMGDGQYGVRRAAFRAMARLSQERLRSLCTTWALLAEANVELPNRPFVIDMRRKAAEAAAWLESEPIEGPVADLAWDPEPEVRATFARCRRERRQRDWAAEYLHHVLGASDNRSLLTAWKYAQALERVGDDDALERLEDRRRQDLPAGVRHWLGRLIKKLRTRWDEVTRSWPEPWFVRPGRLERVDALVGEDESRASRVSCWLWLVPATDLVDFSVWGGWCVEAALRIGVQTLRVPNRRPATILVTQSIDSSKGAGPTYFRGSGPYPQSAGAWNGTSACNATPARVDGAAN